MFDGTAGANCTAENPAAGGVADPIIVPGTNELGARIVTCSWALTLSAFAVRVTSGTTSVAGNLNVARLTHTATLLNNGMVLIAAAMDRGVTDLTSAETYLSAAVEPPPNTLQITPATANVAVGETQNFTAIDNYGNPRLDVIWTVSDPSLATVAPDEDNAAILTGIAAGRVLTG